LSFAEAKTTGHLAGGHPTASKKAFNAANCALHVCTQHKTSSSSSTKKKDKDTIQR
jgi:hypothetical protein